ncbi:MAG: 4Fe-4S ferredoxin [Armatimonadia bacterium]|nr:4Fe-4S ferredoxin [Armatimonadia bacterium]
MRKIVRIDEDKCDGCGLCVPSCAEGAIQIIDGKAKVIHEALCDGIGNCLGECPQDAISIEEREAEDFDPDLVEKVTGHRPEVPAPTTGGCPGSATRTLRPTPAAGQAATTDDQPSALANWPVQLHLVPPSAPYLQGADLLIAADCVGFALPAFQRKLLEGRVLMIGCPKLDDGRFYQDKLTEVLQLNDIRSITIAYMEVPCCHGLVRLVRDAAAAAGSDVDIHSAMVTVDGELEEQAPDPAGSGGCPADREMPLIQLPNKQ